MDRLYKVLLGITREHYGKHSNEVMLVETSIKTFFVPCWLKVCSRRNLNQNS